MQKQKAEKLAFEYFMNGYHCAEAMAKTLNEIFFPENNEDITKYATPFGGGIARSHQEVCGALSGALIFIGANKGRIKNGASIDEAMDLSSQFRNKFIEENNCSSCGRLLEQLNLEENPMACKQMVSKMAGIFSELIENKGNNGNWSGYANSNVG